MNVILIAEYPFLSDFNFILPKISENDIQSFKSVCMLYCKPELYTLLLPPRGKVGTDIGPILYTYKVWKYIWKVFKKGRGDVKRN